MQDEENIEMAEPKKKRGRPKKEKPVIQEIDSQDARPCSDEERDHVQKEIEEHFDQKAKAWYQKKLARINEMLNILDQSVTNISSRLPITSEFKKLFEREAPVLKNQIKNIIIELNQSH